MFEITLPSKGSLYGGKVPGGLVTLKPLTAKEEAILYNAGGDPTSKLDIVLRRCLVEPKYPSEELLVSDRLYILIALRTFAHGAEYRFPIKCEYCPSHHKTVIDISKDLEINELGDDETLSEPVSIDLPVCGKNVKCTFLRGKHETQIAKYKKRRQMQVTEEEDPTYVYRMAIQIHSIDDQEAPLAQKIRFVETLQAGDSNYMQQIMEELEPGIDLTVYKECRSCGATNEIMMPFTSEFFRPRVRKSKRSG